MEEKKHDVNVLSPSINLPLNELPLLNSLVSWYTEIVYRRLSSTMAVILVSNSCSKIIGQVSIFCAHHPEVQNGIPLSW
jgi:hypothetical protein